MPQNEVDVSLKTQLEEAERRGHEQGMAYLLAILSAADTGLLHGPQLRYKDDKDSPCFKARLSAAMVTAAKQNQAELVRVLLKAGADANTVTASGYNDDTCDYSGTVLHDAAKDGHTEVVQALLEAGADLYPWYKHTDSSPLRSAVSGGHIETVKALVAAGVDVQHRIPPDEPEWLIGYGAAGDHAEMTKILLDNGANFGQNENQTRTPLMDAVDHGKVESAALLIERGADVNATDDKRYGDSALMIAAKRGDGALDTIHLLLKAGAKVNVQSNDGYTALIFAAITGSPETVRLLVSYGANVFSRIKSMNATLTQPAIEAVNAFDLAADDAVEEILRSEMHQRIAAALSVLPALLPADVRQKIIQLFIEN